MLNLFGGLRIAVAQLVKHLTGDQRFSSLRLTDGGVIVLCPSARHFIYCLVLAQPRKTCHNLTEKFLTGM